jgi:low temperature requirement protein LtrA
MAFVLIAIMIARAIVAVYGRVVLNNSPRKGEIEHNERERQTNLTLAGFALAALIFILTAGGKMSNSDQADAGIQEASIFLSISLGCFIVGAYLLPINTERYYSYAADSLELLGLLSIGVAMLSLFVNNLVDVTSITVTMIYLVFLVALTTLAIYHTLLVFRYFRASKRMNSRHPK